MPYTSHFLKNHHDIILPIMSVSSMGSFFSQIPHQNSVCNPPIPTRATCSVNLIFLDLITRKIFGDKYRSLSSSLWTFLHSLLFSSLLGLNILLSTIFQTPSFYTNPRCKWPSFTPTQTIRLNYSCVYPDIYSYGWLTGRNTILQRMTACIPWLQSALNFFLNRILVREVCSQITEIFHPFQWTIINFYIVTSPGIL